MNLSDLLPPERVREIVKEAWKTYHRGNDGAVRRGLELAAPEIASNVLEMAAKQLERKAAELQLAKQTDEVLLNRAVRLDDADIVRQLAKEITDA